MTLYELTVVSVNPCGGEAHAHREILDVETDSPEAYARSHSPYPIREDYIDALGDRVIVTGNEGGYIVRYTFSR